METLLIILPDTISALVVDIAIGVLVAGHVERGSGETAAVGHVELTTGPTAHAALTREPTARFLVDLGQAALTNA